MNENNMFSTLVSGYVIYKYDFTNDKNQHIQTAKGMFNFQGFTLYINSRLLFDKEVGSKVAATIGFNGKDWVVLSLK